MKPRILQHGPLLPELEAALAEEFDPHSLRREADPPGFLAREGGRFEGLVTSGRAGADAGLLDALPALRVIANFGVGCDAIDLDAAKRRGIAVANTPDVLTDCVADLAFGLLIDVARRISAADRFVRRGDWLRSPFPLAVRVSGKRLGILGLGRIGAAIARRAAGFDMEVRYHGRRPVPGVAYGFEETPIGLARWADSLVIAAAGGAGTRGLVSSEVIDALGPDGFLINVSRGSIVDEPALVRALREQRIAGAALDVYSDEPNVPPDLVTLDNVVLLPHVGSATRETRAAMVRLVLANLRSFFATGRLVTPVS
jgi:lactate dehydrogenase-like 2-hydroxyacid dehydrogenase